MKTKLAPNIPLSQQLYLRHKASIKPNLCYNNIFHIVTAEHLRFITGEWKVAYGYVSATGLICCRHAFVWSETDGVIDPTLFGTVDDAQKERTYYIAKIFDASEYIEALSLEDGYPALETYLHQEDIQAQQWALENGLIFIN